MRGKMTLLLGVAIGYVLGARAGRERYEDIKKCAGKLWHNPRVQQQVHEVGEFAKDKAPDVVDFLSDSAKKVVGRSSKASTREASNGAKTTRKAAATRSAAGKSTTSTADD